MKLTEETTEIALLYPATVGGPLVYIMPCEDEAGAERTRLAWLERGIESRLVQRTISAWTDCAPDLNDPVAA